MTTGVCSNCRQPGQVRRYRMAYVGLRWLDDACHAALNAMGMHIVLVSDEDPRVADRGPAARRRLGLRVRTRLAQARAVA